MRGGAPCRLAHPIGPAHAPTAAGKRYLARPDIHNDRARFELGWRARPAETTIVDSAESLRDLGLLEPAG
jgi:hypothetical protein